MARRPRQKGMKNRRAAGYNPDNVKLKYKPDFFRMKESGVFHYQARARSLGVDEHLLEALEHLFGAKVREGPREYFDASTGSPEAVPCNVCKGIRSICRDDKWVKCGTCNGEGFLENSGTDPYIQLQERIEELRNYVPPDRYFRIPENNPKMSLKLFYSHDARSWWFVEEDSRGPVPKITKSWTFHSRERALQVYSSGRVNIRWNKSVFFHKDKPGGTDD